MRGTVLSSSSASFPDDLQPRVYHFSNKFPQERRSRKVDAMNVSNFWKIKTRLNESTRTVVSSTRYGRNAGFTEAENQIHTDRGREAMRRWVNQTLFLCLWLAHLNIRIVFPFVGTYAELWGVAQRRSRLRGMLSLHAEMLVSPNATNRKPSRCMSTVLTPD